MAVVKIQLYVTDYKIYIEAVNEEVELTFYYIAKDGVSAHKNEEAFKETVQDGTMKDCLLYKGIHF